MRWTREQRGDLLCFFNFGKKGPDYEVLLSKGPSSTHTRPPLPFAKHLILNVWQYSEYVYVSTTAQHNQNSHIFSTLFFSGIYACMVNHIHQTLLRHIQTYSGLFSQIQHPIQPSHSCDLVIFWALAYLEL